MVALVVRNFPIYAAGQMREAFSEAAPTNMYAFIGKHTDWDAEPTPNSLQTTVDQEEVDFWPSMLALKKVQASDVEHAIPRYNWANNTVYREYDNTSNTLFSTPASSNTFYILTDNDNVYKCLFNNRGAASTVKPTGTGTTLISTADGYIWKYMYSISGADKLKFLTTNYMLVEENSAVVDNAVDGIDIIDVRAAGNNYIYRTGTLVSATSTTVVLEGAASGVDDFFNGSSIYISAGTGISQLAQITDYIGASRTAVVNPAFSITPDNTSQYIIGPTVTITGNGSGAKYFANVTSGSINYINKISSGLGYTEASVTVTDRTGSGANVVPYIPPPGGHGSDPIYELNGRNLLINVTFEEDEANTFPYSEFRQYGLLKDPLINDTTTVATGTSYDQTVRLNSTNVTGSGAFTYGERITGGTSGATANFVSFANTNATSTQGVIRVSNTSGNFTTTEILTGAQSGLTAVLSTQTNGDLEPYTGKLLYIENRTAIQRQIGQTEDIKIIVNF